MTGLAVFDLGKLSRYFWAGMTLRLSIVRGVDTWMITGPFCGAVSGAVRQYKPDNAMTVPTISSSHQLLIRSRWVQSMMCKPQTKSAQVSLTAESRRST